MTAPDEYELTEINKTLASVVKMNEVYAGELMIYLAITRHTAALYDIESQLSDIAETLAKIETDLRTPEGWAGP